MVLYLLQNFISAQYLEKQLVDFHQILYMHSSWQDLAWDSYILFFANLYQSYGSWFTLKFRFHLISWELLDIFSPNLIYAFILTRSSLGLLHIIFWKFAPELWPFMPKFRFSSISWEPIGRISPNLLYMHSSWQDLAWDCYTSFFTNLYQSYGPWFMQ